ncbi:MAG: Holliday junction branch migration protein RuvA [Lachnospiraceae bacterium]|nr:Holliday junction branch migration protein RuvA [Lachnospiraceae bacterium]
MISSIHGKIIYADAGFVIVECAGVGYKVNVPKDLVMTYGIDDEILLYTYLQFSEQNGFALYGFLTVSEEKMFEQLLGVNSVGAKVAMSILSAMGVNGIASAIASNDAKMITAVQGVGAKTASKIILELRDKIDLEEAIVVPVKHAEYTVTMKEAIEGLVAFGFKEDKAASIVAGIEGAEEMDFQQIMNIALKRI